MITKRQRELAEQFSTLHRTEGMFILPNVWNAGSAYSYGYPDGEELSLDDLVLCVGQISRRVDIPLSVDFERGYGSTAEEVRENARRLIDAGAVGFNLEDGMTDGTLEELDVQLEKIRALADLRVELDLPFVINARTCAYWLNVGDDETKEQVALDRCNSFIMAGADCVFIPGAMDEVTVAKLVKRIDGPVNIILNPLSHDFDRLQKIGVRRLSIGSGAVRSIFGHLIDMAKDLKDGRVEEMLSNAFSYKEANRYFGN